MFIKKYNQFINESRSQVINTDKNYIDVIKEHAPWYMKKDMSDVQLYRGLKRNDDFLLVNPKGSNRSPLGNEEGFGTPTPIYYDLIMNHSEQWKKFSGDIPRSESIFCTNDEITIGRYGSDVGGSTYVVIPLEENSEFIMAFTPDTYGAFTYIDKRFGIDMPYFSREAMETLELSKWDYDSLDELKDELDEIANSGSDKFDNFIKWLNERNFNTSRDYEDILRKEELVKEGSFSNWFVKMFDPVLNQFERVEYNSNIKLKKTDKYNGKQYSQFELWTNKPCLLVNSKFFKD